MENERHTNGELKKITGRLLQRRAPLDLWDKLETRLFLQENFGLGIQNLPVHSCPEKVWESISGKLNGKRRKPNKKQIINFIGIAASLLIAVVLFVQIPINKNHPEAIMTTYEENIIRHNATSEVADPTTQEAMSIIREYCSFRSINSCESTEFKQLVGELNELTDEIRQLESMYPAYINAEESPELVKMKIKIENTRAEVLKTIMNLIQS